MRYFGQTKDYWLDNGTLHDWADIYNAELRRCPPADKFVAEYFNYEPPSEDYAPESEVFELDLPEFED